MNKKKCWNKLNRSRLAQTIIFESVHKMRHTNMRKNFIKIL